MSIEEGKRRNILFVTLNHIQNPVLGGEKASARNYRILSSLGNVRLFPVTKVSNFSSLLSMAEGNVPPIRNAHIRRIREILTRERFDLVFLDSSLAGRIAAGIADLAVPVIVFYHNCETDYVKVRFPKRFDMKGMIYSHLYRRNEELSSQAAAVHITFTQRDADRIRELFGTETEFVIPLSIEDTYHPASGRTPVPDRPYCLLLGPALAANVEGYDWFRSQVSPYLTLDTVIAGKGFDAYRSQWETDRIHVYGYVEDVADLYVPAACVAVPLLDGSGMKIKVAEALMYGKHVCGTVEAFVGYEPRRISEAGSVCHSSEEFCRYINGFAEGTDGKTADEQPVPDAGTQSCGAAQSGRRFFSEKARELYLAQYSLQASTEKFAEAVEYAEKYKRKNINDQRRSL